MNLNKMMRRQDLFEAPQLISESDWLRTYRIGPHDVMYESKFLVDGLEIRAESFIATWPKMSEHERCEFGTAYLSKPEVTTEDEQILNYLMGYDGRSVWTDIPILLIRHSDRKRVVQFLEHRITEPSSRKANYYQALGEMRAVEAAPLLRQELSRLEECVHEVSSASKSDILEYIACIEALFSLSREEDLKEKVKPFLVYSDPVVQFQARQVLETK